MDEINILLSLPEIDIAMICIEPKVTGQTTHPAERMRSNYNL